uniref:Retrovirus-related Pol polyprotein from transposon 17.6 n=1 Tax=Cajanus cajan TaxID=3821 RepID=A0A151U486_CAJCA|nr:Retrovirus-related Pol polyprotein from transposon 17.6 [Cajanus cajan]
MAESSKRHKGSSSRSTTAGRRQQPPFDDPPAPTNPIPYSGRALSLFSTDEQRFLGGLKHDIQMMVQMFQPTIVSKAFSLARLYETVNVPQALSFGSSRSHKGVLGSKPVTTEKYGSSNLGGNKSKDKVRPSKSLTPTYMNEQRARGLCYICDEPYSPEHSLTHKKLEVHVMEILDEEEVSEDVREEVTAVEEPQISINVLTGITNFITMRVTGYQQKFPLHILIDSASTHNFLDIQVDKKFGCKIEKTQPVNVTVADGNKLSISSLEEFSKKFKEPEQLPPFRHEHDHKTPLVEGDNPINKRPYRYAKHQKDVIDKLVQEYLKSGVIQNSSSPYASPVVLVGKKDGSWRLCIDYRDLNRNTVKKKFPIPLVEDLMDELQGSSIFSKIDLRARYNQVRMDPDDVHKTAFRTYGVHYERFVKGFGVVAKPLSDMLKKDNFVWNQEAKVAFQQLKDLLSNAPVLALPDWNKVFIMDVNASGYGIGAVLMQDHHPIAYINRVLNQQQQSLSNYEKELLAVVFVVQRWRHYLLDRHFIVRTDHYNLKYLLDQRLTTVFQQKWLVKLMEFDFSIEYKHGHENVAGDALSRIVHVEDYVECKNLTTHQLQFDLVDRIKNSWVSDVNIQKLISELEINAASHKHHTWHSGELRRKGKLLVGNDLKLRSDLLNWLHCSAIGGHSGIGATMQRVK